MQMYRVSPIRKRVNKERRAIVLIFKQRHVCDDNGELNVKESYSVKETHPYTALSLLKWTS